MPNQRIEALIEQSYVESTEEDPNNGMPISVMEFDKHKFAELIIRECARIQELRSVQRHGLEREAHPQGCKHEDAKSILIEIGIEDVTT